MSVPLARLATLRAKLWFGKQGLGFGPASGRPAAPRRSLRQRQHWQLGTD